MTDELSRVFAALADPTRRAGLRGVMAGAVHGVESGEIRCSFS